MVKILLLKDTCNLKKGDIVDVNYDSGRFYQIGNGIDSFSIHKEYAEVVEDVEKSCDTCGLSIKNSGKSCAYYKCGNDLIRWQPIETTAEKGSVMADASKIVTGREQRIRLERECDEIYQEIVKNSTTKPTGKFENIGRSLGELVDEKQQAYGDAITAIEQLMKVLYPDGVKIDQYRDMLLMVRIMDKQCRIAKGDKKAFGESPFNDIAGYGLLGVGHGS